MLKQPLQIRQQVDTRNIILEGVWDGIDVKKKVYYIPGYLRIKVKNFTQMNLDNLNAKMNATIIFNVYYGNLDKEIIQELKQKIILLFGRDNAIQLTEQGNLQTKVQVKEKDQQIKFTIRKLFQLRIQSDVFWSPFELINLILTVTVQPVQTKIGTIKINLLDLVDENDHFTKISYTQEGTFGNYDLAEKKMRAVFSNDRVCKLQDMYLTRDEQIQKFQAKLKLKKQDNFENIKEEKKQVKIKHFQYAHFNVPLYKFPMVALATIFLPLWLLAVINLGIFFQDNGLSDRIASIASLMIAFVALIPTIREQIPPNPKIVFVQYLVYAETLTSLFALIHSLDVRDNSQFNLIWYEDGLFLVSAIITVLTFISVVVLLILHKAKWQIQYNKDQEIAEKKNNKKNKKDESSFDSKNWVNENCDLYFTQCKTKLVQKNSNKRLFYVEQSFKKRKQTKKDQAKP